MVKNKKVQQLVDYWIVNSRKKLKSIQPLYEAGQYPDALFYGHMVLEMILKACVVQKTGKQAPFKHNLKFLAETGGLELPEEEMEFLGEINQFNMEARYPEEKMEFYKQCNKCYTNAYLPKIISMHKKLCQKLKSEK